MTREPLLKVENLSYFYGKDRTVLHQISTILYDREKIAVIGANGAGKSTFFLSVNGVLDPGTGTICYRGTWIDKKNRNELRKHVGIVFQDADQQMIASTVKSEVAFGPMNLKLSMEQVKARTVEAMEYMNLVELSDRPPHSLSGGEKKRVSIADIIAMKPELMIFDEPATALDPVSQQMLEKVLARLGEEGITLMISTHDVDFAYRWAERILVFSGGEIIADGGPVEIFADEDILKRANLKKPVMLKLQEMLHKKGILKDPKAYPKTVEELSDLI